MVWRFLARLAGWAAGAALLVLVAASAAVWLTLPVPAQSLTLKGLGAPVRVAYDADGIPRITAASMMDAAAALGAVHARDRMFQMELTRRTASGRLSEIAGGATLRLDRMMRTLGLRRRAEAELASLPGEVRARLEAYARGVNAMLSWRGRFVSPEFIVLGRPEPWSAVDSLLWGKLMALWLSANWRTELARASLAGKLPPGWLEEMWPPQAVAPGQEAGLAPAATGSLARLAALTDAALPRFPQRFTLPSVASNEWAVDGRRTESGAPLLAGDPHLAYGLPGIWYLARIDTPEGMLAGATAPGVPFMVLGHNGRIAWTFTTTGADTEDVFVETVLPDQRYASPNGPLPFVTREERVRVRGGPDLVFTVRETRHGPVISDLDPGAARPTDATVLAVAMAALAPGDTAAQGVMALNDARTVQEAGRAATLITAPVQNLLVADKAGIAQFTTGRIPVRKAGRGQVPASGADGGADWIGFAAGDQLPHHVAPASGQLLNANERIASPDFAVFLGADWFGDWRARRIRRLLDAAPSHSVRSFAAMQLDSTSAFATALLPVLRSVLPTAKAGDPSLSSAAELLRHWNGEMDIALPQPLIFNAWLRRFEGAVLARAGVPPLGPWTDFVAFVLSPAGRHWCGEDCTPLLVESLKTAIGELKARFGPVSAGWRWGDAHVAVFGHPLLRWIGAARIAQPGDDTTIFRGGMPRGTWNSVHGPAFRGVYDLADLDSSVFSVAPGQSGNPFSPFASNMLKRWREGAAIRLDALRDRPAMLLDVAP